jgi:hypothetical protein
MGHELLVFIEGGVGVHQCREAMLRHFHRAIRRRKGQEVALMVGFGVGGLKQEC